MIYFKKLLPIVLSCCLFSFGLTAYASSACSGVIANQSSKTVVFKFSNKDQDGNEGVFYTGDNNSPTVTCSPLTRNNYKGDLTCTFKPSPPTYNQSKLYYEMSTTNNESDVKIKVTVGSASYNIGLDCYAAFPTTPVGSICIYEGRGNNLIIVNNTAKSPCGGR